MKIEICDETLKYLNNLKPIEDYFEEYIELNKRGLTEGLTESEYKDIDIRIIEVTLIIEYLTNIIKNTNN